MQQRLFQQQDLSYKNFHAKLMPTIDPDTIIGVRIPVLRKIAKDVYGTPEAVAFMAKLPHTYYEENNLHAFLIAQIPDFDTCVAAVDAFLPYIDNWATCDSLRPVCFRQHPAELLPWIQKWMASSAPYTVRFGIEMLMTYYLDDHFTTEYPKWVAGIQSGEYYVNMMIAWYFATALSKQWAAVVPYLEGKSLPVWVHNKTIQKAVESYRITAEQKAYLRTLILHKSTAGG
ncbi:MAG: DNA alkylation repair protein [Clostridia bacterium]|nr:DNA alkylation repair protein [Clostridia bacterium]